MAPGTPIHARLQARIALLIGQHLMRRGGPCWVGTEPGVQPRAQARQNIRVPDLGVTCRPDEPTDRLMHEPILLVEILSPSNHKDTRGNVLAYTSIPSVIEILIIDSTRRRIELLRRNGDGTWPDDPTAYEAEGNIELTSIGLDFTIGDVYAGTHLDRG